MVSGRDEILQEMRRFQNRFLRRGFNMIEADAEFDVIVEAVERAVPPDDSPAAKLRSDLATVRAASELKDKKIKELKARVLELERARAGEGTW